MVESSAVSKSPKNRNLSVDFGNVGPELEVGDKIDDSASGDSGNSDEISDVAPAVSS